MEMAETDGPIEGPTDSGGWTTRGTPGAKLLPIEPAAVAGTGTIGEFNGPVAGAGAPAWHAGGECGPIFRPLDAEILLTLLVRLEIVRSWTVAAFTSDAVLNLTPLSATDDCAVAVHTDLVACRHLGFAEAVEPCDLDVLRITVGEGVGARIVVVVEPPLVLIGMALGARATEGSVRRGGMEAAAFFTLGGRVGCGPCGGC